MAENSRGGKLFVDEMCWPAARRLNEPIMPIDCVLCLCAEMKRGDYETMHNASTKQLNQCVQVVKYLGEIFGFH